jgi:hypothetical protein
MKLIIETSLYYCRCYASYNMNIQARLCQALQRVEVAFRLGTALHELSFR